MFKKVICGFAALLVVISSFCACSSNSDLDITFKRKTTAATDQETTVINTTENTSEEATEEITSENTTENSAPKYTANQQVNVRANPDYNSEILGVLENGETVVASSVENGWALIDYNGAKGYVSTDYLSLIS